MNHFVPFDFYHEALPLQRWLKSRGYDAEIGWDPLNSSTVLLKVFYEYYDTSELRFLDCSCTCCAKLYSAPVKTMSLS